MEDMGDIVAVFVDVAGVVSVWTEAYSAVRMEELLGGLSDGRVCEEIASGLIELRCR